MDFQELIKNRYSVRSYQDRPVEDEKLNQVLEAITSAHGPITVSELSRKLSIEPAALEGMIEFWVRKGRLQRDIEDGDGGCACGPGASSCAPISNCASVSKTYIVK